jgi:hypothetical protein
MSQALLITDCDEVLLHMVAHFAEWLDEEHRIHFALDTGQFSGALRRHSTGEVIADEQIWILLWDFFRTEMGRQTLAPGALEALGRIGEVADIVILTNLVDEAHPWRVEQLARHGIAHEVVCNQGGKGPPVRSLVERHRPSTTAFIDDLAFHHDSVAEHAPAVWRLHMIAEPRIALVTPPAEHAHARIDDWPTACDWILERFGKGA